MKNGTLRNIWFINTGILLLTVVLVAKLGYIQIVQGETYRIKAERQYTLPEGGLFDRGAIFFEEKTGRTIGAATIVPDYTLAVDPSLMKSGDAVALADKLAPL